MKARGKVALEVKRQMREWPWKGNVYTYIIKIYMYIIICLYTYIKGNSSGKGLTLVKKALQSLFMHKIHILRWKQRASSLKKRRVPTTLLHTVNFFLSLYFFFLHVSTLHPSLFVSPNFSHSFAFTTAGSKSSMPRHRSRLGQTLVLVIHSIYIYSFRLSHSPHRQVS